MNSKPVQIILIDDDNDEDVLFNESLSALSLNCIYNYADNLLTALQVLKRDLHTCVFVDLNMPKQNGFECITKIRSNKEYDKVYIVLYSSEMNSENCKKATALGANECFKKTSSELLTKKLQELFLGDFKAFSQ